MKPSGLEWPIRAPLRNQAGRAASKTPRRGAQVLLPFQRQPRVCRIIQNGNKVLFPGLLLSNLGKCNLHLSQKWWSGMIGRWDSYFGLWQSCRSEISKKIHNAFAWIAAGGLHKTEDAECQKWFSNIASPIGPQIMKIKVCRCSESGILHSRMQNR